MLRCHPVIMLLLREPGNLGHLLKEGWLCQEGKGLQVRGWQPQERKAILCLNGTPVPHSMGSMEAGFSLIHICT